MVEDIEYLRVQAKVHMLRNGNLFRQVHLGVCEMRTAHIVAAGVPELTICWRITTSAGARAGIDNRSKRIGVEPLATAGLGYARDGRLAVQRYAGNAVRILRAAALEDPVVVGGVGRAEYAERQPAVQKSRFRNLPAAQHLPNPDYA